VAKCKAYGQAFDTSGLLRATPLGKKIRYNLERTLHFIDQAAAEGSRVVLFPEANLTGYYFPHVIETPLVEIEAALGRVRDAAVRRDIWVIVGSIRKTPNRYLNLAHVVSPEGGIHYEYAKINMAARTRRSTAGRGQTGSFRD